MQKKKNKLLKSYFSYTGPRSALKTRETVFLCWIKTTRLCESKPSPAGEMKEA
jgi:hypothetical protein